MHRLWMLISSRYSSCVESQCPHNCCWRDDSLQASHSAYPTQLITLHNIYRMGDLTQLLTRRRGWWTVDEQPMVSLQLVSTGNLFWRDPLRRNENTASTQQIFEICPSVHLHLLAADCIDGPDAKCSGIGNIRSLQVSSWHLFVGRWLRLALVVPLLFHTLIHQLFLVSYL